MRFATAIRPHVSRELDRSDLALSENDAEGAFRHLERAHVLGQASTREHVRVHCKMLVWGIRQARAAEVLGQLVRIVGAFTKTFVGLVPTGNTGGVNVSPFRRLPVPADLEAIILEAEREAVR